MGSASSVYRVIYLDVDGRIQKVVFSRFCSPCDIKELFCTALGLPRSPYRVVPLTGGPLAGGAFKINELKTEVTNRLAMLEKRVELEGLKVVEIEKCRSDIKKLREEMASRNNSSFLDDNKKLTPRRDVPSYPKMLSCLEHMYHDLGLVKDFSINPITLKRWLLCIHDNYRNNPFHNFRHCFCVTQMMYSMIYLCSLQALKGHDIIHGCQSNGGKCNNGDDSVTEPGVGGGVRLSCSLSERVDRASELLSLRYQINARTELAVRYNDISPLENHHCAVAFQIFSQPDCNIFSNFDPEAFKQIRQGTITLILATDMARHGEILDSFKQKKSEGLPVAPFMDREKVTKPTAQIGFIKFVLIPMFETVMKIEEVMVQPLRESRDRYEELKQIDDAMNEGGERGGVRTGLMGGARLTENVKLYSTEICTQLHTAFIAFGFVSFFSFIF
ncbi:hypothetical protein JZ751_012720 [Albula glossodonta]|uniref:PDEase domain-containing protein n=1 Tax=Albula glossodonta TaxID=121402 RepID=A0A8T2N6G8_9TELE|nr:hypothetical protein JZ751_012720 [Albula glossodonta]